MIKQDLIDLIMTLDIEEKVAAKSGSEYIKIGDFIVRLADHFTTTTNTHDIDIIFLSEDNYIIYPTKAMFKKPLYCTTAEEGVEYIQGWLQYASPYVKGPNETASKKIKFKTVTKDVVKTGDIETSTETITELMSDVINPIDKISLDPLSDIKVSDCTYEDIFNKLGWVPSKKPGQQGKWQRLAGAVRAILDYLDDMNLGDVMNEFRKCDSISVERRIKWIENHFGITEKDIKSHLILLYVFRRLI